MRHGRDMGAPGKAGAVREAAFVRHGVGSEVGQADALRQAGTCAEAGRRIKLGVDWED